jgi:hypothetical protein
MKTVHRKKKRGSNQVFLPSLLLICFTRPRLVRVKSCKSCELYPVSIKWSPVLLKLQLYWNWGWNRDYRIKIGTNNRVTLRITLILGPKKNTSSTSFRLEQHLREGTWRELCEEFVNCNRWSSCSFSTLLFNLCFINTREANWISDMIIKRIPWMNIIVISPCV